MLKKTLINGLRKLLNICEQFSKEHGLKYNVEKIEMLFFRAGKSSEVVLPVFSNGSPVRVVKSFKYLGHILTDNLKDDGDMERERRALAVRANMIVSRFARCTDDVKVTLFKAFCQCFYTCQLWTRFTKRSYNALRIHYNNAFRILMQLPRFCSAKSMFAVACVPDFFAILRTRTASFWERLRRTTNTILCTLNEDFKNLFVKYWPCVHRCDNNNFRF
ncbi:jg13047 [Pararge aegeria aegeria]|uniref:Jg13047 protein n=1 Tax=Pararge aegeria aegeria TaxID=348720 RepID=A0A8S4QIN6_9NEOP|nr:jg13047 [Pararge aegeria aegeria]